jgi:hypothetical protein
MFDAVSGTTYTIQIQNSTSTASAINSGGELSFRAFYRDTTPQQGDIYLPGGNIVAFRNGVEINFSSAFISSQLTGIGIDYTKRTMDDQNGGTNSTERLLVGVHSGELVEILKLSDLSYGEGQLEVDFILSGFSESGGDAHCAQLTITPAGLLITQWFGDGYLYVSGIGSLPAFFNTVSSLAKFSNVKTLEATDGDNQPGAPFTDTQYIPTVQITAGWAGEVKSGLLYYTSGGLYVPVGGDEVRTFNITTNTQGALFVKPALIGTNNPGLKGIAILPDNGILLCNGTVVQKYSNLAVLTGTFTPSIAEDAQTLVDITLDVDGIHAYVVDLWSTRVYKFRISDMIEVSSFQSYLTTATIIQMIVYQSTNNPFSGIYVLEPGKRNDTLYSSLVPVTTEDRKIPDPTYKLPPVGE